MTSFGSIGQAAQLIKLAQGEAKALPGLAKRFKQALQQKEPREMGSILAEVKSLGVKAEKAFVAAVIKTEGNTLRESVVAGLSLDQRAEVAKELFSLKGLKGHFFSKASLETKLAKYLGSMGQDKASWVARKDEMVQGVHGGVSIFQQMQPAAEQPAQQAPPEHATPAEPQFRRPPMDCNISAERLEEMRRQLEDRKPRDIS